MTPDQAASAARRAVGTLGPAFLHCPKTLRRARELGLTGWAGYVAGRGGALGDVRPETVAAALGLISPEAVREGWLAAQAVLTPSKVAVHMRAECCRWGTERLENAPGVARLVTLTENLVEAADASAFPLFAAWRTLGVPIEGLGAKAAVALHLLHEHRAAALLNAVRSSGLSPIEALVAGPEGEAGAVAFGWQPPYPKPGPLARKRAWADAVADRIAAQPWHALDRDQRVELAGLLTSALKHVD